ncbi:MAG TPA: pentapeptide repeat-containing protein [Ktedonobacterales bacterium]|nr:pentapeptide repeat-containing protein [Ktedonobacterales bacterium]
MSDTSESLPSATGLDPRDLRADCAHCFALCCVAPTFAVSADFAINKKAGKACPNLQPGFRCGVHTQLRQQGFRGCAVYDCFGAGQKVSQVTFGGRDWRRNPQTAAQMFRVFSVMRSLHELLWYLSEARALHAAAPLHDALERALAETERLTHGSADELAQLDLAAHGREVNGLLLRASELARAGIQPQKDLTRADLIGANLQGADLRGANVREAYLIAADLRGADLRLADVIGADFRDTDLSGADLTGCVFLIQSQLDAAKGDAATKLPPAFTRPAHWS